jgi:acetyl-CoA acetyltransferase
MVGVFEAAEMLRRSRAALAIVGGVESMSRVQIGLGQSLSDWLRRVFQARSVVQRMSLLRKLRPSDIRLFVPEVKNRVTGQSMGEHTEDMAKTWSIGRREDPTAAAVDQLKVTQLCLRQRKPSPRGDPGPVQVGKSQYQVAIETAFLHPHVRLDPRIDQVNCSGDACAL